MNYIKTGCFLIFLLTQQLAFAQAEEITEPRFLKSLHIHIGPEIATVNRDFWDEIIGTDTNTKSSGTFNISIIHLRNHHFFNAKVGLYKEDHRIDSLHLNQSKWIFEVAYGYNLLMFKEVIISAYTGIKMNRFGQKSYVSSPDPADYLQNGEVRLAAHPWNATLGLNATIFNQPGGFSSEIYFAYAFNINSQVNIRNPHQQTIRKADNPLNHFVFGVTVGSWTNLF